MADNNDPGQPSAANDQAGDPPKNDANTSNRKVSQPKHGTANKSGQPTGSETSAAPNQSALVRWQPKTPELGNASFSSEEPALNAQIPNIRRPAPGNVQARPSYAPPNLLVPSTTTKRSVRPSPNQAEAGHSLPQRLTQHPNNQGRYYSNGGNISMPPPPRQSFRVPGAAPPNYYESGYAPHGGPIESTPWSAATGREHSTSNRRSQSPPLPAQSSSPQRLQRQPLVSQLHQNHPTTALPGQSGGYSGQPSMRGPILDGSSRSSYNGWLTHAGPYPMNTPGQPGVTSSIASYLPPDHAAPMRGVTSGPGPIQGPPSTPQPMPYGQSQFVGHGGQFPHQGGPPTFQPQPPSNNPHSQPQYNQPAYNQPVYSQPSYNQSSYDPGQPLYTQPSFPEPPNQHTWVYGPGPQHNGWLTFIGRTGQAPADFGAYDAVEGRWQGGQMERQQTMQQWGSDMMRKLMMVRLDADITIRVTARVPGAGTGVYHGGGNGVVFDGQYGQHAGQFGQHGPMNGQGGGGSG